MIYLISWSFADSLSTFFLRGSVGEAPAGLNVLDISLSWEEILCLISSYSLKFLEYNADCSELSLTRNLDAPSGTVLIS